MNDHDDEDLRLLPEWKEAKNREVAFYEWKVESGSMINLEDLFEWGELDAEANRRLDA